MRESMYVSKMENVEQNDKVKKECCYYELHDGSWLCIETMFEAIDRDWGKDWKETSCKSSSCLDKPDSVSKEDNIKRLIELYKKI